MKIQVHEFRLSDVEDPEIYAAEPIINWERSDSGQWVKEHALSQPYWQITPDVFNYGYKVRIVADLREEDITYFKLKWENFK